MKIAARRAAASHRRRFNLTGCGSLGGSLVHFRFEKKTEQLRVEFILAHGFFENFERALDRHGGLYGRSAAFSASKISQMVIILVGSGISASRRPSRISLAIQFLVMGAGDTRDAAQFARPGNFFQEFKSDKSRAIRFGGARLHPGCRAGSRAWSLRLRSDKDAARLFASVKVCRAILLILSRTVECRTVGSLTLENKFQIVVDFPQAMREFFVECRELRGSGLAAALED